MVKTTKIGIRELKQLLPNTTIYDASLPGFGARRQRSQKVVFFQRYTTADGRAGWLSIGAWGGLTPDQARIEARKALGRVLQGADPSADRRAQRAAPTVSALIDLYLADVEAGRLLTRRRTAKRASTLLSDRGRLINHVRPLLGHMKVAAVRPHDVERMMHAIADRATAQRKAANGRGLAARGGMGVASRTVGLLGAVFAYAIKRGWRADNPAHGVVRPADGRRVRRLSDGEYAEVGEALRLASEASHWPLAVEATRFLCLTGWRSGEALNLKWTDIDFAKRIAVIETKTGRSIRPLARPVVALLESLPPISDSGLVFPSSRGGIQSGFRNSFDRILAFKDLPKEITPHTLRHSFASVAADLGLSELWIAGLLGHASHGVTQSYVHRSDPMLLAAADQVAEACAQRMA